MSLRWHHLEINGGIIQNNSATTYGGAIYAGYTSSTLTINGGAIQGNSTTSTSSNWGGGAIYARYCTFTMNGGLISNNSSYNRGGAIYNTSFATTTINGGTIDSLNTTNGGDGNGIFHSADYGDDAQLHIGSAAQINSDIYLYTGKYILVDDPLNYSVTLVPEDYAEGTVVAEGSDYTLSAADEKKIIISPNESTLWYTVLDTAANQILLTTTAPDYILSTVYVDVENGSSTGAGTETDPVSTIQEAKDLLLSGGTIIIVGTITVTEDQVWELPSATYGSATVQVDSTDGSAIVVEDGASLTLGDITIVDKGEGTAIEVELGGFYTASESAVVDGTVKFNTATTAVTKPTADTTSFTYNGTPQTYTLATNAAYTISGNVQTNAGTYTVKVSLTDTTSYTWADGTTADLAYSFVIGKATPTYTIPTGLTATYGDGVSSVSLATGFAFNDTSALVGNVGNNTLAVTYTPTDSTNYATVTGLFVTIAVSAKEATLDWGNTTSFTYDGTEKSITATVSNPVGNDTVTVTTYTGNTATTVGNYTAQATALSNSNYTLSSTTANTQQSWSILTATMTGVSASDYNAAYDGVAHGITVTAPDGATVYYSSNATEYSTTQITYTNVTAPTTVYYKVTKTGYNDVTGSATVTITAKPLTVKVADALTISKPYDATTDVEDIDIGLTVVGLIGQDSATASGTWTYASAAVGTGITVTVTDISVSASSNYSYTQTDLSTTGAITNATMSNPTVTAYSATYDGAAHGIGVTPVTGASVSYSSAENGDYSATNPTYTNVGTYTVYYKVAMDNYATISGSSTVTINQASNAISDLSITGWTYGDSPNSPNASATFGADTITYTYSVKDADSFSDSIPTNAGTYTVKATVASTNNYAGAEATINFTIAQKSVLEATIGDFTAMTYTGSAQTPSASVSIDGLSATGAWSAVTTVTDTTTFTASGNFTDTLTNVDPGMAKADYDMSGATFSSDSKTYNATTQNLAISGSLPTGADGIQVSVVYSAGLKNIGSETITATFSTTSVNYNTPSAVTATLTISAKELTITGASATDFIYNGETAVAVFGGTPSGVVDGDSVALSDTDAAGIVADKHADTDKAVTVSGYTISGDHASNYSLTQPTDVVVTIAPKAITAVWTDTSTVYNGHYQGPNVAFIGTVDDDTVATVPTKLAADSYSLTLENANTNYTISNPTTSFTIAKAPVTFTVSDNVVAYDGTAKTPTLSADQSVSYTIHYTNTKAETVETPTDSGTYNIYATINNDNYRHATTSNGAALQIGVLTIYTTVPTTYTVTFSDQTTDLSGIAGTIYTLPTGSDRSASEPFAGWTYNNVTYKAGDLFTQPSKNVTMVAIYQEVFNITGTVEQAVTNSDNQPLDNAVVTLMSGSNQIAQTTTATLDGTAGAYSFSNVPAGTYNIVVSYDGVTRTSIVTITDENVDLSTITMPEGTTNSIVDVSAGTPDVVVGGLDEIFQVEDGVYNEVYTPGDGETVTNGGSVELALTVEEVTATVDTATQTAIGAEAANVGIYLDINITKTVTTQAGEVTTNNAFVNEVPSVLTFIIPIPSDYQNMSSYTIYRQHDYNDGNGPVVEAITTTANGAGEKLVVNQDKTEITLYAKYFSTYALGYTEYSSSSGSSSYSSSVSSTSNGSVSITPSKATSGSTVIITTTPDEGYEVGSVSVTYSSGREVDVTDNGDGTYSYLQPGASITITVTFVEIGSVPSDNVFADVSADHWFYDAVQWAVENGITSGTTDTTFSPYQITTRGQVATFLWRSMELPEVEGENPFSDISDDLYYSEAVLWAVENDITLGTTHTTFSPNKDCSRAHIITFLWRMMGSPVVEGENPFTDVSEDNYYYNAVLWAVSEGITSGTTDTTFNPNKDCTRVEVVTFLYRALAD